MPAFIFVILLLFCTVLSAQTSIEYELDPYYSNIGLYVPLTEKEIETVELENEKKIYSLLLKDAITARFFLVEASINPMPILGTYLKKHQESFYEDMQVTSEVNLIEALTEGFEEPYAVSFFIGNVIRFTLPDEQEPDAINKGYSGFLFSMGDQHIKSNTLIDDDWYEVEWKIKGDRRLGTVYHSWSFRVGAKIHENREIEDVAYLGIRRELFNHEVKRYRLLENTGVDFRIDFSTDSSDLVQSQGFVEKRWPGPNGIFSMGIGFKQTKGKYHGSLAEDGRETHLILRPGFQF